MGIDALSKIDLFPSSFAIDKGKSKHYPLYPYEMVELSVVFVYGIHSPRKKYTSPYLKWGLAINWMEIFWIISATILCILRRRMRLRRDGFISCAFDMFIAIFGGGNLRIRHKLERLLFGIVLIGSFFMLAIWADAFLFICNFISDQQIDTFEKLVEENPSIFISHVLKKYEDIIFKMLRIILNK